MNMRLHFLPDLAVLVINDDGHRIEVRGHKGIGTDYLGDRLDRIISAMPRTVNLSELFADNKVGVRSPDAVPIRAALAREDAMVDALRCSYYAPRGSSPHNEPWYQERTTN